jgi:hypothetical protein
MTCEWVDLSPEGDSSEIFYLSSEISQNFFNQTRPTVRIIVDAPLDFKANLALASTYLEIAQLYPAISKAPSLEVGVRRTTLTFRLDSDDDLLKIAYFAILPFKDAAPTHRNIIALLNTLQSQELENLGSKERQRIRQLITTLSQAIEQIEAIDPLKLAPSRIGSVDFFQAPTNTVITNSSDKTLNIYYHSAFGKHLMSQASWLDSSKNAVLQTPESTLPPVEKVIEFINAFDCGEKSK